MLSLLILLLGSPAQANPWAWQSTPDRFKGHVDLYEAGKTQGAPLASCRSTSAIGPLLDALADGDVKVCAAPGPNQTFDVEVKLPSGPKILSCTADATKLPAPLDAKAYKRKDAEMVSLKSYRISGPIDCGGAYN